LSCKKIEIWYNSGDMKSLILFIWEVIKIIIVALLIVIPIRYFVFQPFLVRGQSMEPNFSNSDYLIVDEISYRFDDPQRGDVIVFRSPAYPSQNFIKRVIGLPGEEVIIEKGVIKIIKEGEEVILDESEYLYDNTNGDTHVVLNNQQYFVLGDNRDSSYDSRRWGPLPEENIIGKVFLRAWPFSSFTKIEVPSY
jgi:signal peptidase I